MTDESDPFGLPVSQTFGPWTFDTLGLTGQGSWNLRIFGTNAFRSMILWSFGIDPAQCFQPGSNFDPTLRCVLLRLRRTAKQHNPIV
jgi:hypothetical protein